MTNSEFSNEFDVLYNNITSNQAPGLNEYEKSVFITKAQDEVVKSYFDPRLNKPQEGFDGSERRQIDFSMIVKTEQLNEVTSGVVPIFPLSHSKFYALPNRILMFINESLKVTRGSNTVYLNVIPLQYTEYSRLMSKPYKRPLKNQAWRLLTNTRVNTTTTVTDYHTISALIAKKLSVSEDTVYATINNNALLFSTGIGNLPLMVNGTPLKTNGTLTGDETVLFTYQEQALIKSYINRSINSISSVAELIAGPSDTLSTYTIRYVARPNAVILCDLEDNLTIDGYSGTQQCELDPILHHEILQRAVELAKAAFMGDLSSQVALGQSSETNMGIVASK